MNLPVLPAFLLAALLLPMPGAFAQEAAPTATSSDIVRLEQLPEKLQKVDDEIARKLDEVRALLDSEAAAKHITEPVAQSLRWSLRTTATAGAAVDVRALVSTMRVPTDNSAMTQAVKELETTYVAAQAQRAALALNVSREIRRRAIETIRTAAKPADLEAMQALLASANEALRRRASMVSSDATTSFSRAEQVLRGLRRLMEAEIAGKPEALGQAMNQLRNEYRYEQEPGYDIEIQARLDRVMQPYVTAAEKAEDETAAALLERKPSAEIEAALARFGEAAERFSQVRMGQSGYGQTDLRQAAAHYRTVARAVDALRGGEDENIANRLSEARNAVRQLSAKRAAAIEPMLTKLEAQMAESAAKMASEREEKLRARIVAVKEPSDLDAIATDLRRWAGTMSRSGGGERENWNQLASQLGTLSAAWTTSSPALLQQDRFNGGERLSGSYAAELLALRKRIERDVLSRALAAPELNAPPFAEKPPDTALDALCDDLAAKGEWRRLYDILGARSLMQGTGVRRSEDDALIALRSFFAAQNLELAEQWADAIRTYKSVLQCPNTHAPIKPAAERIKALAKEHPQAAASTTPASRAGFPER